MFIIPIQITLISFRDFSFQKSRMKNTENNKKFDKDTSRISLLKSDRFERKETRV